MLKGELTNRPGNPGFLQMSFCAALLSLPASPQKAPWRPPGSTDMLRDCTGLGQKPPSPFQRLAAHDFQIRAGNGTDMCTESW